VGSLCTGYGGLDLGVLAALGGGRIAWVADPDPHMVQILDARTPGIPNLGDLRQIDWAAVEPVDVLVAGFPCLNVKLGSRSWLPECSLMRGRSGEAVGHLREQSTGDGAGGFGAGPDGPHLSVEVLSERFGAKGKSLEVQSSGSVCGVLPQPAADIGADVVGLDEEASEFAFGRLARQGVETDHAVADLRHGRSLRGQIVGPEGQLGSACLQKSLVVPPAGFRAQRKLAQDGSFIRLSGAKQHAVHCAVATTDDKPNSIRNQRGKLIRARRLDCGGNSSGRLVCRDRLPGFAGNTDLVAGRYASAVTWLTEALDLLAPQAVKQRAVLLLDLAAAHAFDDPDHAITLALQGCDVLESEWYVTAYQRLPAVRAALEPSGRAAQLTERVRALPLPAA
jgi:hypothetical protein